jgi:tetratricopeptide (TPR) repeat protein
VSRAGAAWREHLPTVALVLLGLALYARGLVLGFVGDDFTLLDAALRYPLGELLTGRHGIVGFYRPVSRELYFWWWGRVVGLGPGGFHLVNAVTFAAVVVMIERLGRDWAGPRAGRLAAAAFVLFPPGSALLAWVSCAQDLIALFWALAALLLYRHGRYWPAAIAVVLAVLSKETAVVMPLVLLVLDRRLHPRDPSRATLARLAPSLLGFAVTLALAVAVRSTWPAGTAVAVWSPRQIVGAWRLPLDLVLTLLPPDTGAGLVQALESQPALIVLVAMLAAFAVPARRKTSSAAAPGARTAAASRQRAAAADRPMLVFAAWFAVLALLPVGFVVERWRGYYFSLAAVGMSLAAGVLLARIPSALARGALAIAAVVNFAAGGIYRPVEAAAGPARHPHANYAFFRETGAFSERLLAALEPWCGSLRALPRTFAAGIPPEPAFESVLGPGLRVTCRDTVARVRFLAEFTPADARTDFGVLRYDAASVRFVHERADARVRARVGEGFLIHSRYDVAAACFEAATEGRPADRELSYPLAVALAAAGRGLESEQVWRAARGRGAVLEGITMAERMLGRVTPAVEVPGGAGTAAASRVAPPASDTALAALSPLATAVLAAPWEAGPHRALGRRLLALGRGREATFELAVAAGITHELDDLAWLAQGYEAMGALDEALAAYQRALSAGLPHDLYESTRTHFLALVRRTGARLDPPKSRP